MDKTMRGETMDAIDEVWVIAVVVIVAWAVISLFSFLGSVPFS